MALLFMLPESRIDELVGMLSQVHVLQQLIDPFFSLLRRQVMKPSVKLQILLHA